MQTQELLRNNNSPLRGNQWQRELIDISLSEYQDLVQGKRIEAQMPPQLLAKELK